jgi:hypothetical protein
MPCISEGGWKGTLEAGVTYVSFTMPEKGREAREKVTAQDVTLGSDRSTAPGQH